jgi:hypothetical protein
MPALSITPVLRNALPVWIMRVRFQAQEGSGASSAR